LIGRKYAAALAGQDEPEFDDPDPIRGWAAQYLNVWPLLLGGDAAVMPTWHLCATSVEEPGPAALALAVDMDRVWLSLGAASAGDVPHLGSVFRARLNDDRAATLAEVARISAEHNLPVVLDGRGPAESLIEELEALDVDVEQASLGDYLQACADLFDAVAEKRVTHGSYADLDAAVAAAGWRTVNDRRAWSRKKGDVSMLEAVTLAFWQATRNNYDLTDSFG
jgi:hypothetical protein